MRFKTNKNIEQGITTNYDRKNRFVIKKYKAKAGFFIYLLSNSSNNDRLAIPHYLMDKFRAELTHLSETISNTAIQNVDIDQRLNFKDAEFYRFQYSVDTLECLTIIDLKNSSRFNIYYEAIPAVVGLLYDPKLDHPNGIFDRIINYHQLFQFTFNEGSESITSGLSVRSNTLIDISDYVPLEQGVKDRIITITRDSDAFDEGLKGIDIESKKKSTNKKLDFKRKLGERSSDQNYVVDYDLLFGSRSNRQAKPAPIVSSISTGKVTKSSCPVPLLAGNIKSHTARVYKCELTPEDASALRNGVLSDRDADHLLGFEIFSGVYKSNKKLKRFSFPLYYLNVKLEESGRFLHIYPPENGDVYLNHLSLAVFVERFSKSKKNDPLAAFFNTLLSQKIEIDKKLQNITIYRQLPYSEDVFRQTREILIGHQGENGKGGIIERLDIIGIECDLNAVMLYKADRNPSPLTRALDQDLKGIQRTAHEFPNRFYESLLGKFLNPELKTNSADIEQFCPVSLSPGTLTKSSKRLLQNLNKYDLVLLEGPPGTGKTFTIQNLLIHCLNSNKKLLIVSDQKAAIHALSEKLQEYLIGKNLSSPTSINTMNLWKSSVKIIDEVPSSTEGLGSWINKLSKMLQMELSRQQDWPSENPGIMDDIYRLDSEYQAIEENIRRVIGGSNQHTVGKNRITSNGQHTDNNDDILDLTAFLVFIGAGQHSKVNKTRAYKKHQKIAKKFIQLRVEMLNSIYTNCYADFRLNSENIDDLEQVILNHIKILETLVQEKPTTETALHNLFQHEVETKIYSFLVSYWKSTFNTLASGSFIQRIKALFIHPCVSAWSEILKQLKFHYEFLVTVKKCENPDKILRQFNQIHCYLDPSSEVEYCLAHDICQHLIAGHKEISINYQLEQLSKIQKERDILIKEMCLLNLTKISKETIADRKGGTNRATRIINILESLKSYNSIDSGSGVPILKELQEALWESFPIWICRKQAVSFLFPSKENMIDLVVVDEAGQCRVDDALPLLYRAKKLMVVGDDKQTVVDKNSVIDDYLFREAELEEHLRNVQARGVKGGGSNLFELVKSIKQGGVLLDEHYRCPPSIISYSNQYVYNHDLKIMQWQLPYSAPSVVVDFGEKFATSNKKATRGKYKGIETEMVDRFLNYVAKTIKRIELETQKRINVETDVAICYFLLKNEVYIKDHKTKFLEKLGRGSDVLDGAGAALQGKERDYIFYFWDINSSNFTSFRQGDDPDKRKGEMNVLMSRPKIRAYHYLHGGFESLKHDTASIVDYLWKTYHSQNKKRAMVRSELPAVQTDRSYIQLHRSSGHSIFAILSYLWEHRSIKTDNGYEPYFNIVIGNPKQKVDLMLVPKNGSESKSIAIVDLDGFKTSNNPVEDLVDYYFQLQRAVPSVDPIFTFVHEISDERSHSYQQVERKILGRLML